jgi:hypothetical protein
MKVANEWDINAHLVELISNVRNGSCSFWCIDCQSDQLRTSQGQLFNLNGCADDVNGIRVCHGLNTHWGLTTYSDDALTPNNLGLKAASGKRISGRNCNGFYHFLNSVGTDTIFPSIYLENTTNSQAYSIRATGTNFVVRDNTSGNDRLTITSGGNVGIGTTNPSQLLEVVGGEIKAGRVDSSNEGGQVSFGRASDNATGWYIDVFGSTSTPALRFVDVSNSAVRMTINSSGNVLIGSSTTTYSEKTLIQYAGTDNQGLHINQTGSTGANDKILFSNGNGIVGYIRTDGSSTSYVTTSDYRLKEDLKEIKGLEKLSALKVYDFKWKNSQERMDGVLAHELAEVLPYAVHGEKDGEQMQGVDYSKIVPILIKSIQELKSENDTLKSILQRNNIS